MMTTAELIAYANDLAWEIDQHVSLTNQDAPSWMMQEWSDVTQGVMARIGADAMTNACICPETLS